MTEDRFVGRRDLLATLRRNNSPLLVMHGERDPGIAIQFGERLFMLAHEPKRLVRFPMGGHDDLDAHVAIAAARDFLYDWKEPPIR